MENYFQEQLMLQAIGDEMDAEEAARDGSPLWEEEDEGPVDKPWLDGMD